jgi:hypothetical protein
VAAGADIRGLQLAGGCEHAVGVCDNGEKAGGADDGAAGAAGGADGSDIMIRDVQLGGGCKHAVGVCENGDEAGGAGNGAAGVAGGGDMRGVQLAECLQAHRGQPQAVSFSFMLSFSPVLLFPALQFAD